MYNPQTLLQKQLFPNLGRARVTGGPFISYIGREGTIIQECEPARSSGRRIVRIAFNEFWYRPNDVEAEDAMDNGYFFEGEFEEIAE